MREFDMDNIVAKLDVLQDMVLDVQEKAERNFQNIARFQSEVVALKESIKRIKKDLRRL